MSEAALIILIALGFFIIFPLFWCFVVFLVSRLSGWAKLAMEYPDEPRIRGETFTFSTASIRFISNYANCLNITVADKGVRMEQFMFFKIGHDPIFIPWSAVTKVKVENVFLYQQTHVYVASARGHPQPWHLRFYGARLAEPLKRRYKEFQNSNRR